jgi:hypothetical protein
MRSGKALHIILAVIIAIFLSGHILLNDKKIQQDAALHVVKIARNALGTDVCAERIQLTYPFGIAIDNLTIYDLNHDTLAHAASISLHIKPFQLLRKKISITSLRINSPKIMLKTDSVGASPNYSFLMTMPKSDGAEPMKFRANSVLIRNASLNYDLNSAEQTDSLFNRNHIGIHGLSANLSLKAISSDSISLIVRKFTFSEQSGFKLSKAQGNVVIGKDLTLLSGLSIATPSSQLDAIRLTAGIGMTSHPSGMPDMEMNIKSIITAKDFKAFAPQLSGMSDPIDISINGQSRNGNLTLNSLRVHAPRNIIDLGMSGTLLLDSAFNITDTQSAQAHATFKNELPYWLATQLSGFGIQLPDQCFMLGDGSFKFEMDGYGDDMDAGIGFISQIGTVNGSLYGQDGLFNGELQISDIDIGAITADKDLGKCNLTAHTEFKKEDDNYSGTFNTNVGSLTYKDYAYKDITINGTFDPNLVLTNLEFKDHNGKLNLNAGIGIGQVPFYTVQMEADTLNLAAYKLTDRDNMTLTASLSANLIGKDIDDITGKITIDSLNYTDESGCWSMDNMTLVIAQYNELVKVLTLYSDFMNISVAGNYKVSTLPGSLVKACGDVLPTIGNMLASKHGNNHYTSTSNSFVIEANVDNIDFVEKVLHCPLSIGKPVSLQMTFIDDESLCMGSLSFPSVNIADKYLTDGLISINSSNGTCHAYVTGLYGNDNNDGITFNVSLLAFTDIIRGNFAWNNSSGDMNGNAKTLSQFLSYDQKQGLKSVTFIDTTSITVNGNIWDLSLARITTDMHKLSISGFSAGNDEQYIYADGTISSDSSDVFNLSMRNINLNHTLSLLGANDVLKMYGMASCQLSITEALGNPVISGSFQVDDFQFMDSYHGHLTANCRWNRTARRMELDGTMHEEGISSTKITGTYVPETKFMDVILDVNHTDLYFLNTWTKSTFKELNGRAVGQLRLFGNLPDLDLEGETILENGKFIQAAVNTTFTIKSDTLWFKPGKMIFKDVEFYDERGHDGLMTCILDHNHFSNWKVDMTADVADMLVYDIPKSDMSDIYATVYAEGTMALKYDEINGLAVSVNARTAPGTRLGYKHTSGSVADYNFLTIVDRNTVKINEETVKDIIPDKTKERNRYSLDLNIQCSEDATIEMSIASLNGLFRGNGDISIKYNPKDGPVLTGIYNLTYGQCTLSLEDLIRKNFTLADDSYVRFNGAPMDTELHLQTYHSVNSVSIYDLDPSASSNNKVRVRCLLGITGNATDPKLTFDIDMPSGTSEEKDILASATATEEQRNKQFMYLLVIGRFYTYDVNAAQNTGRTPSAMESLVNSTVSGQINNLLSQVLDNDKVSISSNLSASSYLNNDATNLNNKELEGILEAHLLNNRLLVNGNFGYRENTINNTSNFIGDFEVKYLLLPRQGISIKGYSKSNDKYFSKTTLTTQGVGLVFEKDF